MWKKWVEFILSLPRLDHQLNEKVFKIIYTFKNETLIIYEEEQQKNCNTIWIVVITHLLWKKWHR